MEKTLPINGMVRGDNAAAPIFDQVVRNRRSVRVFDAEAPFDHEAVTRSLHRALLAPNSSNLQLWEFHRIRSPKLLKEMKAICLNQNAAGTAREIVVMVCRRDKWKDHSQRIYDDLKSSFSEPMDTREKRALKYYGSQIPMLYWNDPFGIWTLLKKVVSIFMGMNKAAPRELGKTDTRIIVHKSTALAAQTFMLSMKAEGFDTCPMEGFDSIRLKKLLKLPRMAEINMVVGCGPGREEGVYGDRFRFDPSEAIIEHT